MHTSNWIMATSYGIGTITFLGLLAFQIFNWNRQSLGIALVAACALNTLWLATATFWSIYPAFLPWPAIIISEAIRDGGWLYLLSTLLQRTDNRHNWIAILPYIAALAPIAWISYVFVPTQNMSSGLSDITATLPNNLILGGLVISIIELALLEQVCRNIAPERRWALKYLCIGIGIQIGYDIFLYSEALLYHRISAAFWDARGAVVAMAAPMLMIATTRNPQWTRNFLISRQAAFRTATLLSAGAYLITISAGGYYIRYWGGTWGKFWLILFISASLIALLILLSSGKIRATARVFLVKNFFTYQYDYRVEWYRLINRLYRIDDLSSPYEKAIKALAEIVDSPGGALWAKQDQEKYFKPLSNWNFPLPENAHTSPESPLVKLLTEHNWIIDSRNDNNSSDVRNHYPEWLISLNQWWLIIPLSHESKLISFVILSESRAPHNLSWEDLDLLKTAAQQIAAYLAQYEISQSLSQARQFQTFNQLSTFLMHDLKNLIAQQSLLVQNANKHKHNLAFVDDMIATIDNSVQRMSHILNQLQNGKESKRKIKLKIGKLIDNIISTGHDRLPHPELKIEARVSNMEIVIDDHAFTMVLLHLIRNAQDACTHDDTIEIHISVQMPYIMIDVSDTGCGMTEEFIRNRLFTPFDSTKSSRGMGIGAYQARTFARLHGGDVEVESKPGVGTKFRLWFLTIPDSDNSLEAEMNP